MTDTRLAPSTPTGNPLTWRPKGLSGSMPASQNRGGRNGSVVVGSPQERFRCSLAMVGEVDRGRMCLAVRDVVRRACRGALAAATEMRQEDQDSTAASAEVVQAGPDICLAAIATAVQTDPRAYGTVDQRIHNSRLHDVGVGYTCRAEFVHRQAPRLKLGVSMEMEFKCIGGLRGVGNEVSIYVV